MYVLEIQWFLVQHGWLIEAGASTHEITLSPDDPKPPSPEVADLLRQHGVGGPDPAVP